MAIYENVKVLESSTEMDGQMQVVKNVVNYDSIQVINWTIVFAHFVRLW